MRHTVSKHPARDNGVSLLHEMDRKHVQDRSFSWYAEWHHDVEGGNAIGRHNDSVF
jgi:hypothetical protein